jgi:hypothetical protein
MTDQPPQPPPPPPPFPPPPPPPSADGRTGPPWEQPGTAFSRFAATTHDVLLAPTAFFRTMRRQGGLGPPLIYGIVGTVAGGIIAGIYQMIFATLGAGLEGPDAAQEQALLSLFSTGCIVVLLPVLAVLSMVVGAAIYHLMLLLFGAARQPFEVTMRVSAYATGATSMLNVVPVCGGLIAAVWAIIVTIIGLTETHEIPMGKAAAAVLVPIVACCVLAILLYASVAALIVGGLVAGASQ